MAAIPIPAVQIPSKAVSDKEDVSEPVRKLLEDLYLLGTKDETEKAGSKSALLQGPPQSVALIEAGVTTGTKYWAAGLGVTVIAAWARVATWWGGQPVGIKQVVVGGAAFLTAAVAIAISYLLAQDLRGRAAAAVATIEARAEVAMGMIKAAEDVYAGSAAASEIQLIPLPTGLKVRNITKKGTAAETGWLAVAMQVQDGKRKYIVVKGPDEEDLEVSQLEFVD